MNKLKISQMNYQVIIGGIMTKELSKQICQICGIENIYCYPINRRVCCDKYKTQGKDACYNCEEVRYKYPDFGQPENFVKLFKMITTIEDVEFRLGNYCIEQIPSYRQQAQLLVPDEYFISDNINPIKGFLDCVLQWADEDKDTAEYIRGAEWKYD